MARSVTKCALCNDIIWFGIDDIPPQASICSCGETELLESGASGEFTDLTEEELNEVP